MCIEFHSPPKINYLLRIAGLLIFTPLLLFSCQPSSEDKIVIGFSQCVDDDDWRQTMYFEMQKELAFYDHVELIYKNADASNEQQIEDIKALRDQAIDILIVSPNEAWPITPIVEEIYHSGIPVIVVDRKIASDNYTAYVGADNYEIGNIAGAYAANLLPEGGKILEVTGLPGSTPAQGRHQGFLDALKDHPGLVLMDSINGQWEEEVARKEIRNQLDKAQQADLIFAFNDMMARATHQVLDSAQTEDMPVLLGIDGLFGPRLGIEMVNNGILDATFLYPTGGDKAIELAVNIVEEQPYEKENILQTTVIDQSNVKIIKSQAEKIYEQQQDIVAQQMAIKNQLAVYKNQRTLLYVVIGSLVAAIVLGAYALYSLKEKLETNRKLKSKNEEILKQRNQIMQLAQETEEANQAKFRFFTDISHEFRTPITLILTSIEDILESESPSKESFHKDIQLIKKNAARLLRLVSQLLDFRRIEHGKMELKASHGNLVTFIQEIFAAFEGTANKRKIDYQLITIDPQLALWFDDSMLDKVFFNLLSNAFKYTDDGGKILVMIEQDTDKKQARILIKDNGRGMSKEHMAHAFERFYRGEQNNSMGTGLGLSLSRELIQMHHGSIKIDSEKDKGTSFEIKLPLGKDHLKKEECIESVSNTMRSPLRGIYEEDIYDKDEVIVSEVTTSHDNSVLVIEDNTDLNKFLVNKLTSHYQVLSAEDGDQGLALAFDEVPDLIISDIMMPGTDGISIARKLKSDVRTSHIPIILLTARDTTEQQVEGLQTGADAYIVKPFHTKYLMARVSQLLQSRQMLRQHYLGKASVAEPLEMPEGVNKLDKNFLDNFRAIVDQKLSDPELSVNEIAKEAGLSRVQLYRKVKALLGLGVNDYIKQLRLTKAKTLLMRQELSISEIAYEVGFSSPAYFSTVFKNEYQLSPSEYIRSTPSAT
ncbi:signal transduction histidine kinase/DNA-binding response OmpR family regulator [Catalinimonas alkaloidigena]|uniref:substrate-binding domain-containing protein n=1 Tax=Catalinimonas alkaloidigena TaxID=1075417 RepID=UPI0024063CE6|nr:substrate-binding domain-containing protein [Catalinimonas alkaloidigena]MDF9800171.1 signal transduction histidine kinase/DNA-binding response OmpR family regulator [Catalinimonas alkaloidigena]